MKNVFTICIPCGLKNNKKKHKGFFGSWKDTCDLCGEKDVPCASAQHDFGIYNNKKEQIVDRGQDLI